MTSIDPRWNSRETPLRPTGILGFGSAAATLADLLARRLSTFGDDLQVHAGKDLLVALSGHDLPWVDDAIWLGRDGHLLCPTTLAPDLPTDLIADGAQRLAGAKGNVVATPSAMLVLPVPVRSPSKEQLESIAMAIRANQ